MEINVTSFVNTNTPFNYFHSVCETGDVNAGQTTWNNALIEAKNQPLLTTPEQIDALRDWARSSGGWDREEIIKWTEDECNALFIQLLSSELRESGLEGNNLFEWKGCIFYDLHEL